MGLEWITTIANVLILVSSLLYIRRERKAGVRVKEEEAEKAEISTADAMVDLVKKANETVVNTLKEENEKFRRSISKLERAIKNINRCPHRDACPVIDGMQSLDTLTGKGVRDKDGQRAGEGDPSRHGCEN